MNENTKLEKKLQKSIITLNPAMKILSVTNIFSQ